jgi:nicotinamide-nucleotide amidase
VTLAEQVVAAYIRRGWMIATAESCTGGLVAAAITDIPGSSAVFDRGFVTYSNNAKLDMLSVPAMFISKHGAVSEVVALAMVKGALAASTANVSIAITGIAGPAGGSAEKPVGLVHFACGIRGKAPHHKMQSYGNIGRGAIRQSSVEQALQMLLDVAA